MLATAPFSIWPGGAVSVVTDLFSKVIVVFVLIINTLTTRERFERFVNVVVLSCCYVAVRAVLDYGMGLNLVEDGRVQGAGGLFGNPNDMALNLVAFLPLAIILALGRGRPLLRGVLAIGTPAIVAAIIFSKSRGGTLGLVGMLLVLLFQIRRVRPSVAVAVIASTPGDDSPAAVIVYRSGCRASSTRRRIRRGRARLESGCSARRSRPISITRWSDWAPGSSTTTTPATARRSGAKRTTRGFRWRRSWGPAVF